MPQIRLSVFGPPLIECDGVALKLDTRKTLALLVYLAVTGRSHRRESLVALLWPESSPVSGRAGLRNALHALRHALGDGLLESNRETVAIVRSSELWTDVVEFRGLMHECRAHNHGADEVCADCLEPLRTAVDLYQGEFSSGFGLRDSVSFDDWQLAQTESLRNDVEYGFDRLIRCLKVAGNVRQAIDCARRWLELDRVSEEAHRYLIELYAESGQRTAALRLCEECARVLKEELGAKPDGRTKRLCDEIRAGGLSARDCAPQQAAKAAVTNLLLRPTPFIGREHEKRQVRGLLSTTPLLTLIGAGGCGKTRLALEVAASVVGGYAHGAWLVDLAAVSDAGRVTSTVARALDLHEAQGQSIEESVLGYLEHKQLLLMLDNCEHVIQSCAELVTNLLGRCPKLKILATSSEPLAVAGETVWRVPSLSVPKMDVMQAAALTRYDAVNLFVERARSALPGFALTDQNSGAVAQICRRLGGIPLALELAAVRVRVLSIESLLARLDHRFELLTGGNRTALPRHRTLRATVDWSYALLDAKEKALLSRLGVFAGSWNLEAAEAVCADPDAGGPGIEGGEISGLLARLVDKSMVVAEDSYTDRRYSMLETIRQYGVEKLEEAGEGGPLRARHGAWFLELAERAEPELYGSHQGLWLSHLDEDYDNMQAAMALFLEDKNGRDGLRLAGALGWYWFRRARYTEGLHWLNGFLDESKEAQPRGIEARALYYLGWLIMMLHGWTASEDPFSRSLELYRQAGDRRGIALTLAWVGWHGSWFARDNAPGYAHMDESVAIAREAEDPWVIAHCLRTAYSGHAREDRDIAFVRKALEEAIDLSRRTGDSFILCWSVHGLGDVYRYNRHFQEAVSWFQKSLEIARDMHDWFLIFHTLRDLGDSYIGLRRTDKARECFAEALKLATECGANAHASDFLEFLGYIAMLEGHKQRAARIWGASKVYRAKAKEIHANVYLERRAFQSADKLGIDEETFAAEWAIGREMTLEQAVEYALEDIGTF